MGSMFRSEEMVLCQFFIQPEAAYAEVSELGEAGTVQFRDLCEGVNAFQRRYVSEIRRCDEMARKLRFVESEAAKEGLKFPELKTLPQAPHCSEFSALESLVDYAAAEITELCVHAGALKASYIGLTELMHVLERTEVFFEEARSVEPAPNLRDEEGRGKLDFVAGVIRVERIPAFERMLWRVSRGNIYLKQSNLERPIENPRTGIKRKMAVFVVFFQGMELKSRVIKICQGFHATMYPCSAYHNERRENLQAVRNRLRDLKIVLTKTKETKLAAIREVLNVVPTWHVKVKKMKAIYHTMNMFDMDVSNKCLVGECWVPTGDLPNVRQALIDGGKISGSRIPSFLNVIPTNDIPPTFNRTNKFTKGFQDLIDAYGISSYREANPALYTIITFPFLFAVMFGDVGHGLIMALFGSWMCWDEKNLKKKYDNEIWNIFFAGRYIILLMGLFSIYTGFTYNTVFSRPTNIFGSSWRNPYDAETLNGNSLLMLDPKVAYIDEPYAFGMDPIWFFAKNAIIYNNSHKMKLSIIFGVAHMIFGVCMSVVNYNYFKRRYSILLEFLPQIVFLLLLFGYMVFLMFYKWLKYSCKAKEIVNQQCCAPSVLITIINMMLFSHETPEEGCKEYMFEGQGTIQPILVMVAVSCIPVMLLGKPLYLLFKSKRKYKKQKVKTPKTPKPPKQKKNKNDKSKKKKEPKIKLPPVKKEYYEEDDEILMESGDRERPDFTQTPQTSAPAESAPGQHHEDEPFSEILIHQAIHTIEYVLSTISHTASYLRLWALALAHEALSEVLWGMVLSVGLKDNTFVGGIKLYVVFYFWAILSVGILVMMEGLSAFLHTLRLHWVEFMSKFFSGVGYAFMPFSFTAILEHADEENEDN